MNVGELNNQKDVCYRIGRAGRNNVDWQPWTTGKLYVQRREKDLPKAIRGRCAYWQAGSITTLTIQSDTQGWAEYTQADYQGNGVFLAEDYYLEIEGLV